MATTVRKEFAKDFKTMNKKMKPLMEEFVVENNIHLKPFIFFLAALIRESLKEFRDDDVIDVYKFKEAVVLFILDE